MQNFSISKTHALDNVQFFKENSEEDYCKTIQEIIASDPFGGHKFYIFQFVKRINDVTGEKKMIHQPRLTKPDPLPGTTLLRVDPRDPGTCTIIWTLPNQETFDLYKAGKMFEDQFVDECVNKFLHNRAALMQPEDGDLSEEDVRNVYRTIKVQARRRAQAKQLMNPLGH